MGCTDCEIFIEGVLAVKVLLGGRKTHDAKVKRKKA
jgi:hypothetical protein